MKIRSYSLSDSSSCDVLNGGRREVMAAGSGRLRMLLALGIAVLLLIVLVTNDDSQSRLVEQTYDGGAKRSDAIGRTLKFAPNDPEDQSILTQELYPYAYPQTGWMFKETGRTYHVKAEVTTTQAHSFSPYVEREAARRFIDPPRDQIFLANSPAVIWYKGELVLVARIWLDREVYEPKDTWPPNHFADNYLYTQKFDRHLRPLNNGSIMGIPCPKQWWVGDGPIEPRLTKVQGHLYVTFNAAMAFKQQFYMDFTIMYDYEENLPIIPKIKGGTPMLNATEKDDMPRDKHWMALIQNDELYFVHNLDPLRVMKCSTLGFCEFVHDPRNNENFIFEHHVSHLRGGTPFEPYTGPYYISIAHSTMYKTSNHHRYYTAHIVVLCVKPYRVVYVSDDIKINQEIYDQAPMARPRWIEDGFIFPVGLIIENKDSMLIGVHVNDWSSILVRMRGLKGLMDKVITLDQRQNAKGGPPIGTLQQHIHDSQANLTHMGFVHS